MKKIFIALLGVFLFFGNLSYAATDLDFIYINGSATNNEDGYKAFHNGINKFHPVLKAYLEKDEFVYEHMLKNGEFVVPDKPSEYFWGYKSKEALAKMNYDAYLLKGVSPILAYAFRDFFAGMMHDAIWIKDDYNMMPIINELHAQVMQDAKQGKKVVLLGYSAGTFITTEYLLMRSRYINLNDWSKTVKLSPEIKKIIKNNPRKNTCTSAFFHSKVADITLDSRVIPNANETELKSGYMNLDKYTEKYCVPDEVVAGVINYASPIPLFYSGRESGLNDYSKYSSMAMKHGLEQDFFFLTVNFSDDPLGFPNNVNHKNSDIEKYLGVKLKNPKGFFYDYSQALSYRTMALAHTSYWNAKERFAKAIVKAYKEGYNFQYGTDETDKK